jgi:PAS domain S-box-containing protein
MNINIESGIAFALFLGIVVVLVVMWLAVYIAIRERAKQKKAAEKIRGFQQELQQRFVNRAAQLEATVRQLEEEVSKHKQAEEEIRKLNAELEQKFIKCTSQLKDTKDYVETIMSTVRMPLVVLDAELRVISANLSFYQTFQVTPEETEQKLLYDLGNHQWDIPSFRKVLEEVLFNDTQFNNFEVEEDFPTIGQRVMLLNASQIRHKDNQPKMILLAIEDITEHKRWEEILRKRDERFKQVAENAGEWIWEVDVNGLYTYASPAVEKILGYEPEEIIGIKHFYDFFAPDMQEEFKKIAFEIFDRKETFKNLVRQYVHRNSNLIFMETSASPVLDDKGNLLGYRGADKDITERKQSEEEIKRLNENLNRRAVELEAANKEIEAFSYSVSHDLRAPLRAIVGFSSILLQDYLDKLDDEGKRLLNIIRSNTKKMGELIDDLLALSRIGRKDIELSDIDMDKLVNTVCDEIKAANNERKLQFDIKPLPPAYCDSGMIYQVFFNFLFNAIKFTKYRETAIIEVGGYADGSENVYYVKDNGVGFDMRYKDKLFGAFQRLHSEKEFEGTGIGLAIVKRIINRHGGRIWAEGKVDEGATFYFTLSNQGKHSIVESNT